MNAAIQIRPQRVIGRPFPKGVSGNPAGYKPIENLDVVIRRRLDAGQWFATVWAIATTEKHRDQVRALELLANRAWGSPRQTIGLSRDEDDPGVLAMRQLYSALRGEPLTGISGLADEAALIEGEARDVTTPEPTVVHSGSTDVLPTEGTPRTPPRKPRRRTQEE